eukprot:scaffold25749_cov161-Skeletonema_marinoi.AAC.2
MLMLRSEQIMVCEGNASFAHHMVLEEYYNQLIRYATITVSFAPKLQTAAQHFAASQNVFAQQKGGHQNTAPTTCLMLRCFYPVVIKENQSDEESHPLIPGVTQWSELLRFHQKSSLTSLYVNCRVADVNRKSHSGTRRQFAVLRERAWGEYYANSKC